MTEPFTLADGGAGAEQLRAIFAELKALDEEKQAIAADFNEKVAAAKEKGFDGPTLRRAVIRARKDPEELLEADGLLETYEVMIGTGAAAAGTLSMKRNEDGVFEARMIAGDEAAAEKSTRSAQARRNAVALAELAARAREDGA